MIPLLAIRAAVMAFLRALPWYAFAIAAALVWGGLQHVNARHWHKVADVRGHALQAVKSAQIAADIAAKAEVTRVEAAQAVNNGRVESEHVKAMADLSRQYADFRLRRASYPRTASARYLPAVSDSTEVTADTSQPRDIIVASPLGLLEEGDEYRLQVQGWQHWYDSQIAVSSK